MKRNATITIRGQQYFEDSEENTEIDFVTDGEFESGDGKFCISYKESEMTGLAGISTTISVEADRVVLSRLGDYSSEMIFEHGERHHSIYNFGEGMMTMCVGTNSVNNRLHKNGGSLAVDYTLEVNHALLSKNNISIKVELS